MWARRWPLSWLTAVRIAERTALALIDVAYEKPLPARRNIIRPRLEDVRAAGPFADTTVVFKSGGGKNAFGVSAHIERCLCQRPTMCFRPGSLQHRRWLCPFDGNTARRDRARRPLGGDGPSLWDLGAVRPYLIVARLRPADEALRSGVRVGAPDGGRRLRTKAVFIPRNRDLRGRPRFMKRRERWIAGTGE